MLTGYNTDVAYDGVTYHVQTEDKGLANPIILSLVYQGGTILAAKRTSYGEMVSQGEVDEKNLALVLERQHQVIIAAIRAGKIEQLIKRSAQANGTITSTNGTTTPSINPEKSATPLPEVSTDPLPAEPSAPKPNHQAAEPVVDFNLDQILSGYLQPDEARERLKIELLTSPLFVAGEHVKLRAAVLFENRSPVQSAVVKLQIVGTHIKPQSFVAKTDHAGNANFTVTLPMFTSGTAALILQAEAPKGQEAEIKFLIRRR